MGKGRANNPDGVRQTGDPYLDVVVAIVRMGIKDAKKGSGEALHFLDSFYPEWRRYQDINTGVEVMEQDVSEVAAAIGLDTRAAVKLVDLAALNEDGSNAAELVQAVAVKYPGLVSSVETAQPAPAKRTDEDRRRDFFMGGSKTFFNGGGVKGLVTE